MSLTLDALHANHDDLLPARGGFVAIRSSVGPRTTRQTSAPSWLLGAGGGCSSGLSSSGGVVPTDAVGGFDPGNRQECMTFPFTHRSKLGMRSRAKTPAAMSTWMKEL